MLKQFLLAEILENNQINSGAIRKFFSGTIKIPVGTCGVHYCKSISVWYNAIAQKFQFL